jgi:hypothetical protein
VGLKEVNSNLRLSLSLRPASYKSMSTSDDEARRKAEKPIATPAVAIRLCKELYGLEVKQGGFGGVAVVV